nr:MAG TPA: hypothetical protein [Caudoviricetes sp.]
MIYSKMSTRVKNNFGFSAFLYQMVRFKLYTG